MTERRLSSGIFVYDPKAKSIPNIGKWWLIIQCCPDLGRYYREMVNRYYRGSFKVQRPAWDAHISVIRGEEPSCPELWNTLAGQEIEFWYEDALLTNDRYYWMKVDCPAALDAREQLGLPRQPLLELHLTVGIRNDSVPVG